MTRSCDPRDGGVRRHHPDEKNVRHVVRNAVRRVDVYKKASCHIFRHCFATHLMTHSASTRSGRNP
ncbi:MAG TPA: hypothetical protein ENG84_00090 [Gammaproteobacteria bacterium]|nr:hypothetical protein [Gammaproteobacteria bacterium]